MPSAISEFKLNPLDGSITTEYSDGSVVVGSLLPASTLTADDTAKLKIVAAGDVTQAASYIRLGQLTGTPSQKLQTIQLAIDNLSATFGGGTLYLGPHLYDIDRAIQARSNVRICGQGKGITRLRIVGDTAVTLGNSSNLLNNVFLAYRAGENLVGWGLYNLTLDGNRLAQNTLMAEDMAGSANDSVGNCIRASSDHGYSNSDWEIVDVECINAVYHGGIMVGTLTRGEISRCRFSNNGYRGFHIHGDGNGVISSISVGTVTTVTVTGMAFQTGDAITIKNLTGAGAYLLNGKTFTATVTGANTFTIPVNTTGFTITAAGDSYAFGGTGSVGLITVHHNKCFSNGVSQSTLGGAGILSGMFVVFDNASEFQVTDNQVWSEPGFGLEVNGATPPVATSHFNIIAKNSIRNCGQGIKVSSGLSQSIISNNIITGSKVNTTPSGNSSGHGLEIGGNSPSESLIMIGNIISGNSGYGIIYQDPGTIVHRDQIIANNIISGNIGRGVHIVKCGDTSDTNTGAMIGGNVVVKNMGDAQVSQVYINTSYKCMLVGNMIDTGGASGGNLPMYVGSGVYKSAVVNNMLRRNGGSNVLDMYAPIGNNVAIDGNITDNEGIWPNGQQLLGGTVNAVHATGSTAAPAIGNVPAGTTVTFGGWERVKYMDSTGAISNGIQPIFKVT